MRHLVLALSLLSGCIGYGPFISVDDAYQIESKQCRDLARGDAEELRKCQGGVERKYQRYHAEGDYPAEEPPHPVR